MNENKKEEHVVALKVENKAEKVEEKRIKSEETIDLSFLKRPLFWQLTSVLFIILLIVSLFSMFSSGPTGATVRDIGADKAKERIQEYVDSVLQGRFVATLGGVEEEAGLYKIDVSIQGQTIKSYITKDGRLFFPNVVDLDLFKALGGASAIGSPREIEGLKEDLEEPELEETEDEEPEDNVSEDN